VLDSSSFVPVPTLPRKTFLSFASSVLAVHISYRVIAVFVFKEPLFINNGYRVYVCYTNITLYRVIHKSVKHFKNSQQIDYATNHDNSYTNRVRNSPSFFTYFTDAQCVHLW
jgi:hypothetical protein